MKEIDLSNLTAEFPYKWKVQSFSKSSKKASCVAYIEARDVMDRLDQVVGPANWKSEYIELKGHVYCKLSIKVDGEWVAKMDIGTPSDFEGEKGEASDALKRAAVHWGIGRFLYSLDIMWVDTDVQKMNSNRPKVVDRSGKAVYDLTKHINELKGNPTPPPPTSKPKNQTSGLGAPKRKPPKKTASKERTFDSLCEEYDELLQAHKDLFTPDYFGKIIRGAWFKEDNAKRSIDTLNDKIKEIKAVREFESEINN